MLLVDGWLLVRVRCVLFVVGCVLCVGLAFADLLFGVCCLRFPCLVFGVWCLLFGVVVFGVCCLVFGVWYSVIVFLVLVVRCLLCLVRCLVFVVRCALFVVRCLLVGGLLRFDVFVVYC